jgi:hypothetical protein
VPDPIYYVKEFNVLYRRRDGNPNQLPDQQLKSDGWRPIIGAATISADSYPKPSRRGSIDGGPDPLLWTKIWVVSEEEARDVAARRRLPLSGWQT